MNALLKIGDHVGFIAQETAREAVPVPASWMLLRTEPNCERRVAQFLERRGIAEYVPAFFASCRAARGKRVLVRRVMFPGYVFIPDFEMARARTIRMAPGGLGFLHFGEEMARVPQAAIRVIRAKEAELAVKPSARARLSVGQDVRFTEGPFAGMLANVQRLEARERVTLLLHMAGRMCSLQANEADLELVTR